MRQRHSLPIAEKLFADARADLPRTPPKTRLGQALGYLLGQKPSLLRCLTESRAGIENNAVERAIRPLKIGAKNWMQIGHPTAGTRLANLFALVEIYRQEGVDPEAYLIDIIARLAEVSSLTPTRRKMRSFSVASAAETRQRCGNFPYGEYAG